MEDKRWFFVKNGKSYDFRWVHTFIRKDIEWDDCFTHLVVSMDGRGNRPDRPNECKIESVKTKDFFISEKEAQIAILLRDKFGG